MRPRKRNTCIVKLKWMVIRLPKIAAGCGNIFQSSVIGIQFISFLIEICCSPRGCIHRCLILPNIVEDRVQRQNKDRVTKQLKPLYEGPFQVIGKKRKYFTLKTKDKTVTVSTDRLKGSYFLQTPDFATTQSTQRKLPAKPLQDSPPQVQKLPKNSHLRDERLNFLWHFRISPLTHTYIFVNTF